MLFRSPVGHLDLASTFCDIAGIETPDYYEGDSLPQTEAAAKQREFMLTEWDSEHGFIDMHQKSIYHRDGWLLTCYEKSYLYEGTEGELYNLNEDPDQLINRWEDPSLTTFRDALKTLLYDNLPKAREPRLERKAPV